MVDDLLFASVRTVDGDDDGGQQLHGDECELRVHVRLDDDGGDERDEYETGH